MDEPIVVTNGRFSVSIGVSKKQIQNADFSGIEKLQPGVPDDAIVWKTQSGRTVKRNPITNRWSYVDLPKSVKNNSDDHEAIEKEINDFLSNSVEELIKELTTENITSGPDISGEIKSEKSHGKYTLSLDEAKSFHEYLKNPKSQEKYYVSADSVDNVIEKLKQSPNFTNNLKRIASKGSISTRGVNLEDRARKVISFYLSTGGRCAVTGEKMSFSNLQLDHKIPLSLKGSDTEDNWAMMKPKFNQFKRNLLGDKLFNKLNKEINLPEHLRRIRQLKNESLNNVRNTWGNFLKVSDADTIAVSLRPEQVKSLIKGAKGTEVLKALLNKFEISYYTPSHDGIRSRGLVLSKQKMANLLLDRIKNIKENNKNIDVSISSAFEFPDTSKDNDYDKKIKEIRAEQKLKTSNQKQNKLQ